MSLVRNRPWKKIFFKIAFVLGLLVIEQASFISAILIMYSSSFQATSIRHYIDCLPVMIVGAVLLIDYFKLSNFLHKPAQTLLYESFKYVMLIIAIVCIYAYLLNLYALSRYALVLGGLFCFILTSLWIGLNQKIGIRMYRKGRLLIISPSEDDATKIMGKIRFEASHLHLDVIGWLAPAEDLGCHGMFAEATDVLISNIVGEKDKFNVLFLCSKSDKSVYLVPSFYDLAFSKYRIIKFYDTPTFMIENGGLTIQQKMLKRLFDIFFSFTVLVVSSPLLLVLSLLIRLDSRGKAFYTQDRVTGNGRVYKVIKFRTMVSDAEKIYGAYQSSEHDQRITRLGRFLRKTHLDEWPQFVNVFLGSMSVVGPRSDRTITIDLMEKQAVGYDYRLKVKSGITGLAQIFGKYNSDPEDKLRYDVYYIKNYSLILDLQIVLLTLGSLIPRSGRNMSGKGGSDYFIMDG
jgi:exopolysaccharide biosynthesis polyprenyl glycosylphosphotransferase